MPYTGNLCEQPQNLEIHKSFLLIYCKKRNCHNDWQFVISDSDERTQFITICGGELHPHSQPTFLHIIIPSWQLTVSMQQIGSLICNEHDKLMVKMTILLLLWALTVNPTPLLYCENYTYTRMSILCVCSWSAGVSNVTASAGTAGPIWISKSPTYQD